MQSDDDRIPVSMPGNPMPGGTMPGGPSGTIPGMPRRSDPLLGSMLGSYRIVESIGGGGMGMVYKAWQESMQRNVAIKVMKPSLMAEPAVLQRFQREAVTASRLSHANIVTVHDFQVTQDGTVFLVMDYLQGCSLQDAIKETGGISVNRFINIFRQACDALEHAHKRGVLHRDLKPANIMLVVHDDTEDVVKVVDFGVAKILTPEGNMQKLTQTGEVFGSPVYMSPEQCVGEAIDARADVYAMGIAMYESLTGILPLIGKDIFETIMKHKAEMPKPFAEVRPDLFIPESLEAVIFHALAKEPEDRPQSMAELKDELLSAAPNKQVLRTTEMRPGSSGNTYGKNSGRVSRTHTLPPSRSKIPPPSGFNRDLQAAPGPNLPLLIGGGILALVAVGVIAVFSMGMFSKKNQPAEVNTPAQPAPTKVLTPPSVVPAVKPVKTKQPSAPALKNKVLRTPPKRAPRAVEAGPEVEHPTEIETAPVDEQDRWMKFRTRESH
jgi:eukaryotic-like serine/threonine-protein kinase